MYILNENNCTNKAMQFKSAVETYREKSHF